MYHIQKDSTMFAINDALAHEIIRASHDSNAARAAQYHTTLHPTTMRPGVATPSFQQQRSTGIAPIAMIQQATARMVALIAPARSAEAACCPAAMA